ncbi:uncharacterized protein LOC111105558 isoform X1 [Crassostrea virginica]
MKFLAFSFIVLPFLHAECQKVTKVHSYDQLVSYLGNGADVRYFFNASACMTRTRTASYDEDETPVVGGALNFFSASKDPDSAHIIFSQVRYSDEKPSDLTEEIFTLTVVKDKAALYWGTPGFFVNKTEEPNGVNCDWTKGEGNIWVKDHPNKKQIASLKEIQSLLTSGEKIRWVIYAEDCKCQNGSAGISSNDIIGDTISDFKITKNGSISFSSSMTFMVPLSWRYVRVIVFGHINLNNTVNIRISILDPTTWQDGKDILIMCPIATDSTPKGVRFFSQ